MHLHSLLIRHFRLISDTVLTLQPGIQLFLGLNAQGKTSLIEAIHFLSTSTSHRTNREEDLIQWSESVAFLRGIVQDRDEQYTIECGLEKKRKVIKIDSVPLPRVGDLYGKLRTVLFAPEDLNIVVGSPHDRRRFLDMAIAQLDPGYIPILQQFRRALHQRNHVLKRVFQRRESEVARELAVWDIPYLQNAVHVISLRIKHVKELAPLVDQYYAGLADEGPLQLSYSGGESPDEQEIHSRLKEKLERSRKVELERGSTQVGPHRDDLLLHLQGRNLSQFGSQGQRRGAALALRLAEARHCHQVVGQRPVLLIDDVVYEMDNPRRARFWQQIDPEGQLIVTATDREHLGQGLEPVRIFQVEHGTIHPSGT
ncbi:MAG: DNA replication/repair protein RecF [bacterium]|jgi:DNA replication and repair protein RecF